MRGDGARVTSAGVTRLEGGGAVAALIEAAPDGILLIDDAGQIVAANAAAVELFGYTHDELVGSKVERLLPSRFRNAHAGHRADYIADPRRRPMGIGLDFHCVRADDSEFIAEISLAPVPVDGARLTVAIVRDRSEQRAVEQQRAELARVKAVEEVVSGLEAIVWEATAPDRASLSYLGGSETALLGYARDHWLQEGFWLSVVHPDDRLTALTFAESALKQSRFELEYRLIAADGSIHAIRDIVTVGRDEQTQIVWLRGVIVDVSERRALEAQLAQAQKLEAVGQLAGGIAHDFNNLLTIVSGHARLLLRRDELDSARDELTQIVAAAERATELTRQLLSFARRGQGEPELVEPNELLRALRPLLRRVLAEDIAFELEIAPDTPHLMINRSDLEQIVMNLVLNAGDAMPDGGRLTVGTVALTLDPVAASEHGVTAGPYLLLTVTDSGEGIPDAVRSRIFEPFFTTKPQGKGTGMGLATVYGIVEQLGGFIGLDSAPGKGSRFAVHLPAAGRAEATPAATPETDGPTVLLVEDDEALRHLVTIILDQAGYRVVQAANGRDALSVAERHRGRLDLLVTDVVMPHLSGPELAQRLRDVRPDLQVLFMSGYNDSRLVARGVEQARVTLLYKPFAPEELIETVAGLIERPSVG